MMAEKSLLLLMSTGSPRPQAQVDNEVTMTEQTMEPQISNWFSWLDNDTNALILKDLEETLQEKVNLLNQISSTVTTSMSGKLMSLMLACFDSGSQKNQWSEYLLEALSEAHTSYLVTRLMFQHDKDYKGRQVEMGYSDCPNCSHQREQNRDLQYKLQELQDKLSDLESPMVENTSTPVTHIQIEGEPIDSLDKAIQLQDMIAKHTKELREVKDVYEQEAEKLRQEVAKAGEALRLLSEENVKEIDSLTMCMENLKRKHETERSGLLERFHREMEELGDVVRGDAGDGAALAESFPTSGLKERLQELVTQVSIMTEDMRRREQQGNATTLRLKYEKDLEHLKATCERGFTAMEESHQKVVDELQRKYQRELEHLQDEKDRLLAEETAATIAAIEAMKNAHRSELERELDKARKAHSSTETADVHEIRRQHEEELCSFQREIEVLSEQYSQKCLENAHLSQALEAERQALRQCQRENQELNAHNQELNNRLAAEIIRIRSMTSEEGGDCMIQGKELYELEVMLRVKESEVQYLKQEINSLKDELQAAHRDKKYATDKYKDIYTELSIVKAKAERDLGRLRDQLQLAQQALGEPSLEEGGHGGYDIMKSRSNPEFLKMAAAAAKRSERTLRSKSVTRDIWDS